MCERAIAVWGLSDARCRACMRYRLHGRCRRAARCRRSAQHTSPLQGYYIRSCALLGEPRRDCCCLIACRAPFQRIMARCSKKRRLLGALGPAATAIRFCAAAAQNGVVVHGVRGLFFCLKAGRQEAGRSTASSNFHPARAGCQPLLPASMRVDVRCHAQNRTTRMRRRTCSRCAVTPARHPAAAPAPQPHNQAAALSHGIDGGTPSQGTYTGHTDFFSCCCGTCCCCVSLLVSRSACSAGGGI